MALVKCKQCGNENAPDAKTCPKCGTSLRMGLGKRLLIALGVVVVISYISHSGDKTSVASVTSPTEPRAQQAPDQPAERQEQQVTVTPVNIGTLLSEYHTNEVRADAAFKGKWISTTGTVGEVKKDMLNDVYVTVGTGQMLEIPVVQCFVAKDQIGKAADYSKGDRVTVAGRVEGLMMNVLVKECRFQ